MLGALRRSAKPRGQRACVGGPSFSRPPGAMTADNGRYELITPIARGGMGEIWLAVLRGSAGFEKRVVLKRVLSHLDDDPEFLTRFIDEARIAATLSHANIVSVFDLDEDDEGYFLAMDWIDGWDLRRILRTLAAEDERMPDEMAVFVAAEIAAALAYAHGRTDEAGAPLRIVHRDVSPSNVLIARSGDVKLTDFGIASARSRLGRTATGQLRGKFAYMSPEQASGTPVDGRSDVFALGSLLFEMLSGRKAFDAEGDIETLARVRNADHPALDSLRPDLPRPIIDVVERAMTLDREERLAGAGELEALLRAALVECWGAVGRSQLSDWIGGRLAADPLFRAQDQPGGASLDDILAAQLDGAPSIGSGGTGSARSSATGSSALIPPIGSGERVRRRSISRPGGHTMTHAALPPTAGPSWKAWTAVATMVILVAAVGAAAALYSARPHLVVRTEPPGAQVYVDGVPLGLSDLTTRVTRGDHEVRLNLPGFRPTARTVTAARGEHIALEIELEPSDRHVAFHSIPAGAVVTVGDAEIVAGNSVPVPVGVPVRVRMQLDGYEPFEEEVVFGRTDSVWTRRLDPLPAPPVAAVETDQDSETPPEPRRVDRERERRDVESEQPGELAPLPGSLVLRFASPPLVGDITIDGLAYGSNEDVRTEFQLPAGTHTIAVVNTAAGVRFETGVDIEAGAEEAVTVEWSQDG